MELAKKDMQISDIEKLIHDRKQMLFDKYKELQKTANENEYLKDVKQEYEDYFSLVQKEKREQLDALNNVYKHLDEIIKTSKLTDSFLENSKIEQQEIMKQINILENELNEIINVKK